MPTYDYQCEKCGFEFEREQRITEDPIKTCPECKARKVKRLLSAPGFILKGGGWYADGYGSSGKSGGKGDSTGGDDASGSGSGGASKSETKSDGKSSKGGDAGKGSSGTKASGAAAKSAA